MLGRKYIAEYTPAKFTMKTVNASEIPDTVANKIGFPSNLPYCKSFSPAR
jgi:hypothetical protein